jgi:hypothetical protein
MEMPSHFPFGWCAVGTSRDRIADIRAALAEFLRTRQAGVPLRQLCGLTDFRRPGGFIQIFSFIAASCGYSSRHVMMIVGDWGLQKHGETLESEEFNLPILRRRIDLT